MGTSGEGIARLWTVKRPFFKPTLIQTNKSEDPGRVGLKELLGAPGHEVSLGSPGTTHPLPLELLLFLLPSDAVLCKPVPQA